MIVAIDWDSTLVDENQEWLPGALDALRLLRRRGNQIVIHTCRANWHAGLFDVQSRLKDVGLEHPKVTVHTAPGKPAADCYIDDKAVRFDGSWPAVLRVL